jgi:hypothetical protein
MTTTMEQFVMNGFILFAIVFMVVAMIIMYVKHNSLATQFQHLFNLKSEVNQTLENIKKQWEDYKHELTAQLIEVDQRNLDLHESAKNTMELIMERIEAGEDEITQELSEFREFAIDMLADSTIDQIKNEIEIEQLKEMFDDFFDDDDELLLDDDFWNELNSFFVGGDGAPGEPGEPADEKENQPPEKKAQPKNNGEPIKPNPEMKQKQQAKGGEYKNELQKHLENDSAHFIEEVTELTRALDSSLKIRNRLGTILPLTDGFNEILKEGVYDSLILWCNNAIDVFHPAHDFFVRLKTVKVLFEKHQNTLVRIIDELLSKKLPMNRKISKSDYDEIIHMAAEIFLKQLKNGKLFSSKTKIPVE